MEPFEILGKTPKSNCGSCGYPACLAFAAAVSKRGEDPSLCPFLNPADFPKAARAGGGPIDAARERELALVTYLKEQIAPLDFGGIAGRLGAVWNQAQPDSLFFLYLGQQVHVSKSGILLNEVEPEDPRDQILLYNYIRSKGGRVPGAGWVGMESFPNSISKVRTLAVYCEDRLAELFASREPEIIIEKCRFLQAVALADEAAAISLMIPVLPMVPVQLLFWGAEPEDGFAAKAKILFDRYVLDFLDIESLVFAAERLADRLITRI